MEGSPRVKSQDVGKLLGGQVLTTHFILKKFCKSHVCFADSHDKCCYRTGTGRGGGFELSQRSISREASCHMGSQAETHTQVLEGSPPSLCVNSDTRPSRGAGGRAFLLGRPRPRLSLLSRVGTLVQGKGWHPGKLHSLQ